MIKQKDSGTAFHATKHSAVRGLTPNKRRRVDVRFRLLFGIPFRHVIFLHLPLKNIKNKSPRISLDQKRRIYDESPR